ncbi:MAG: hypothetical protein GY774_28430 [Planctomycetes bacterium]|nr:hypothetical protein [Planctomycetota bacterium]
MFRNNITTLILLAVVLALIVEVANADFIFGEPMNLGPAINSTGSEFAPSITEDGLELYFVVVNRPGGFGSFDIWVSKRQTIQDEWKSAVNLGQGINSGSQETSQCISPDGLELYFSSNRSGGHGRLDLYMATRRTREGPWDKPVNLGPTVNSSYDEFRPQISSDGLSLFFSDNDWGNPVRPEGQGQADIWVTTRDSRQAEWGEPVNLGPLVNSSQHDVAPSLSADGLSLLFGRGSFDVADIWLSRRKTTNDPWEEAIMLGLQFSDNLWAGQPDISYDGSTIYWTSDRVGGFSAYSDIWQISIEPIFDFNNDLKVDLADMHILVDHWGQNYSLCDISPIPFGNGVVDVQDLNVLAKHLYRLTAHWEFDETEGSIAYDSFGDYDGTLNGNPFWQPTEGMIGGTLLFDGIDDYVSTPFILDPSKGSFSVFAWVFCWTPGQAIISQTGDFGETWLATNTSGGKLITRFCDVYFDPLESEAVITDIQWHHVGLVYDLDVFHRRLYVDGILVAEDTTAVAGNPSDDGLYIGASKDLDDGTFFSGMIDDVRIYNQALSPGAIEALIQ